jgi:integrase
MNYILLSTLRIGDAMRLTPSSFHFNGNDCQMELMTEKTKTNVTATIPEQVARFIKQNIRESKSVYSLPFTGNKQNDYYHAASSIERVMKKVPELCEVHSYQRKDGTGSVVTITKPWYEHMSPHGLRRTAITQMLASGQLTEQDIKWMTGHTQSSRSFARYVAYNAKRSKVRAKSYHESIFRPILKAV